MTAVNVRLLGRLVIDVDGKRTGDARLGDLGRKAFAYLVLERRRPVSRDELADALWGEDLPATWTSALRGVLSRLRSTLADAGLVDSGVLRSRVGCYELQLPTDAVIDVERAEAAVAFAQEYLASAPHEARQAAAEAADLAGRQFLPGASGEWVERRQAALATLRVRALELLAESASADGDFGAAIDAAEEAVALAPLHESAHQRLMVAHAAAGNRAAALRAYESCRRLLAEEVGVSPSPETYELYLRLLRDEPSAVAEPAARSNLPPERTSFVGREGQIDELRLLLGSTRLVTLTGPGGVGKSRLATRVAESLVEDHAHGVWLVELAGLGDPALVAQQVLSVLGVPEGPPSSAPEALARYLADRCTLLLIDNCEHLVDACAALADAILRTSSGVRILATSREPLGVPGETTWPVPPLPAPRPDGEIDLDTLLQNESARLFVDRAHAAAPDLDLRPAAADVARICARLEGIPLAIELAAARTKVLSPNQIADRLNDHLGLLVGGPRQAPSRQQTLRAAIDWSFEALSPTQRSVFTRLSVFAGGWGLEAAEAVCAEPLAKAEVLGALAALVEKSLVVIDRRGPRPRFGMLETLRQYAAERLAEGGMTARARTRHLAWAVELAETGGAKLQGDEQASWLQILDEEHDNLRAALDWAAEHGRVEDGLRLAAALVRFWEIRGYLSQGRARLEAFASRAGGSAARRAKALTAAAVLAQRQGDVAGARRSYQEALVVQRAGGDRLGVATALHGLANLAVNDGDLVTAHALFEENLAIARELGVARMEAASLMNLGVVAHAGFMRGHRDVSDAGPDAHRFYGESLAAYEALGDRYGQALALENLGTLTRLYPGDWKEARRLHERSMAIRRTLGDRLGIADSARYIAALAIRTGDVGTARHLHEERLGIERELDNAAHVAEALADLGEIALVEGRLADAGSYLDEARTIYEAFHDRDSLLRVLTDLAELARRHGDHARSRSILDRCLCLANDLDSRHGEAWALAQLARLARAERDSGGALARAVEALAIAEEYQLSGVEAVVIHVAAGVAGDDGDFVTALRLSAAAEALASSSFRPLEAEHSVDHDVALLALGPAGYEQARSDGAALTPAARRELVRALRVH